MVCPIFYKKDQREHKSEKEFPMQIGAHVEKNHNVPHLCSPREMGVTGARHLGACLWGTLKNKTLNDLGIFAGGLQKPNRRTPL